MTNATFPFALLLIQEDIVKPYHIYEEQLNRNLVRTYCTKELSLDEYKYFLVHTLAELSMCGRCALIFYEKSLVHPLRD